MNIETWFNTADIKRYYFPGRIIAGTGAFQKAIELCHEQDGRVVIVADRAVYALPFVSEQISSLELRIPRLKLLQGAPIAQDVEQFVLTLEGPPDVILAIGGGSATDFAKAVIASFLFGTLDGVGLRRDVPPPKGNAKPLLISVPTTAGSGAEASRYYVTYDRDNHRKIFGKSWRLVSDWIMLDPIFLRSVPDSVLVACAFDAFIHFFESMICRHEGSWLSRSLSVSCIARLMGALDRTLNQRIGGDEDLSALLETATIGGVVISNVRTGHIHEAAGALLELTELSHAETLFVFFRDAIDLCRSEIQDHERAVIFHLRQLPAFSSFTCLDDIARWWEELFTRVGLSKRIKAAISGLATRRQETMTHIFLRVFNDKVWVAKESPRLLDEAMVAEYVDRSLSRFEVTVGAHNYD